MSGGSFLYAHADRDSRCAQDESDSLVKRALCMALLSILDDEGLTDVYNMLQTAVEFFQPHLPGVPLEEAPKRSLGLLVKSETTVAPPLVLDDDFFQEGLCQ